VGGCISPTDPSIVGKVFSSTLPRVYLSICGLWNSV
jgi:hypothetical protein